MAAKSCSFFYIFCCYLQWLGNFGQLYVAFYKYFDTRLSLIYVFYIEFGTWAFFLLLFIVNRSPVSHIQLFFTIVGRAQSILWGPEITGPRVFKSQVKDTFEAVMATVCVPEGGAIVRNGSCKLRSPLHSQS